MVTRERKIPIAWTGDFGVGLDWKRDRIDDETIQIANVLYQAIANSMDSGVPMARMAESRGCFMTPRYFLESR